MVGPRGRGAGWGPFGGRLSVVAARSECNSGPLGAVDPHEQRGGSCGPSDSLWATFGRLSALL